MLKHKKPLLLSCIVILFVISTSFLIILNSSTTLKQEIKTPNLFIDYSGPQEYSQKVSAFDHFTWDGFPFFHEGSVLAYISEANDSQVEEYEGSSWNINYTIEYDQYNNVSLIDKLNHTLVFGADTTYLELPYDYLEYNNLIRIEEESYLDPEIPTDLFPMHNVEDFYSLYNDTLANHSNYFMITQNFIEFKKTYSSNYYYSNYFYVSCQSMVIYSINGDILLYIVSKNLVSAASVE